MPEGVPPLDCVIGSAHLFRRGHTEHTFWRVLGGWHDGIFWDDVDMDQHGWRYIRAA